MDKEIEYPRYKLQTIKISQSVASSKIFDVLEKYKARADGIATGSLAYEIAKSLGIKFTD